jgi:hypothetical protein
MLENLVSAGVDLTSWYMVKCHMVTIWDYTHILFRRIYMVAATSGFGWR